MKKIIIFISIFISLNCIAQNNNLSNTISDWNPLINSWVGIGSNNNKPDLAKLLKNLVPIINNTIHDSISTISSGGSNLVIVSFFTTASKRSYTASDIPALSLMSGHTISAIMYQGDILIPKLISWNSTTFTIANSVSVFGGEYVTILYH